MHKVKVHERVKHLDARTWSGGREHDAEDVRHHALGLGKDVQGRDTMIDVVRAVFEPGDVHFDVLHVAELGPFGVTLLATTGDVEGQRMAWEVLLVDRWDGDEIVESWSLRSGEPQPVEVR
jgi:hypothetical protein